MPAEKKNPAKIGNGSLEEHEALHARYAEVCKDADVTLSQPESIAETASDMIEDILRPKRGLVIQKDSR